MEGCNSFWAAKHFERPVIALVTHLEMKVAKILCNQTLYLANTLFVMENLSDLIMIRVIK